jgi:hypothetical protein
MQLKQSETMGQGNEHGQSVATTADQLAREDDDNAQAVPLTEEQSREVLELMPFEQRDMLLQEDYLSLPHIRSVPLCLRRRCLCLRSGQGTWFRSECQRNMSTWRSIRQYLIVWKIIAIVKGVIFPFCSLSV